MEVIGAIPGYLSDRGLSRTNVDPEVLRKHDQEIGEIPIQIGGTVKRIGDCTFDEIWSNMYVDEHTFKALIRVHER